jgi:hypothetical protein
MEVPTGLFLWEVMNIGNRISDPFFPASGTSDSEKWKTCFI